MLNRRGRTLINFSIPQNGQNSAIDSTANISQHKILFPMVHNTIGFARETNSPFTPWSRDAFFEG